MLRRERLRCVCRPRRRPFDYSGAEVVATIKGVARPDATATVDMAAEGAG